MTSNDDGDYCTMRIITTYLFVFCWTRISTRELQRRAKCLGLESAIESQKRLNALKGLSTQYTTANTSEYDVSGGPRAYHKYIILKHTYTTYAMRAVRIFGATVCNIRIIINFIITLLTESMTLPPTPPSLSRR